MNAQEQIAMLRRACEMVWDYATVGGNMPDRAWFKKWDADGVIGYALPHDYGVRAIHKALSATATPPDDAPQSRTALPVYADTVESLRKERDEAISDRNEALAKLEEAQSAAAEVDKASGDAPHEPCMGLAAWIRCRLEMAGNAKPEPSREFDVTFPTDADGVGIPTVVRLSIKTELVSEKLAECTSEEVARRIADLLNAGGGK